MCSELLVRLIYFAFAVGLCLVGASLSNAVKTHFGFDPELKILLPLFSLVFFDLYLRLFSRALTTVRLNHIIPSGSCTSLSYTVKYHGKVPVTVGFKELTIDGKRPSQLELTYDLLVAGQHNRVVVPENLLLPLSTVNCILNLEFSSGFSPMPTPTFSSQLLGRELTLRRASLTLTVDGRSATWRWLRLRVQRMHNRRRDK